VFSVDENPSVCSVVKNFPVCSVNENPSVRSVGEEFPYVLCGEKFPLCAQWLKNSHVWSMDEELRWEKNSPVCSVDKNPMCAPSLCASGEKILLTWWVKNPPVSLIGDYPSAIRG
jgi:hypothetical protein